MAINTRTEKLVADLFADYLNANIDASITATCPVVSFYDPVSIDEANRIICDVPSFTGKRDQVCEVEIIIKSQWTEENLTADQEAHWTRCDAVRQELWKDQETFHVIDNSLVGINFIGDEPKSSTRVVQGFIVTTTTLTVHTFSKEV